MGGAFGGKETQANCFAAVAALGARKTGRPVRMRFSRRLDMTITGKRHPFLARFAAGFDDDGPLAGRAHPSCTPMAAGASISPRPFWGAPCSTWTTHTTCRRLEVTGFVCKTHKTSQTAFRGFGGPQGMLVIEDILDRIARTLELPPRRGPRAQFLSRRPVHALWPAGERRGADRADLGAVEGVEQVRVRAARRWIAFNAAHRTLPPRDSRSLRSSSASRSRRRSTIRPERSCWSIATAACR